MSEERKEVRLNPHRIQDRYSMSEYMRSLFDLPEYFSGNLDSLVDCISEITENTDILLTKQCVREACESKYAFKVLMALGRAADDNPHIHIMFKE